MEERSELSVVIDGKVYRLSGGSDIYLQKLASYVDGKIRELKNSQDIISFPQNIVIFCWRSILQKNSLNFGMRLKYLIRMAGTESRSFMN